MSLDIRRTVVFICIYIGNCRSLGVREAKVFCVVSRCKRETCVVVPGIYCRGLRYIGLVRVFEFRYYFLA